MPSKPQMLENHARYVPGYHFVLATFILVVLAWSITQLVKHPGVETLVNALVALSLLLLFWYSRAFAVTVQDRVIRLEERLRMERLLPDALRGRIADFTPRQLVALRFASDAELPALAKRVLDEGLTDDKAIKRLVTSWRGDDLRA
jgi:hypothetical protein